jgi:two-component system cell cycle response regulator DivK
VSPSDALPTALPTVLIIEDNEDNGIIYATYLAHLGFAVEVAEDAERGLAMIRERPPHVIVMDVGLPGMDGNAATRLLKDDPVTRHIPVVVLTAHAQREDEERALAAGCDAFLTKPLEPRALGAELRRILDVPR